MKDKNKQLSLVPRPPIVVVLGHVDHGKTTLLDFIRKTKIAEKETGGITQHIGAYEVIVQPKKDKTLSSFKNDFASFRRKITFIDTPGHEAFCSIRSRGAKVADIAVLVVAADEGVKSQTKESIDCLKTTQTPFCVALTKIDKEGANPEKVKKELAENEVFLEGWGGDVSFVEISAKTGQGIDELLELILLMAEMEEIKANPKNPASGVVIESHLDAKRGSAAVLIITDGTLFLKDNLVAGKICGKVKILEDFLGKSIKEATFSSPVQVIGFEGLPPVGEKFFAGRDKLELEKLSEMENQGEIIAKEIGSSEPTMIIPLIIKSDAMGSAEALVNLIDGLGKDRKWSFRLLKNDTGNLTEGDLKVAPQEKTLIVMFRVKKRTEAKNLLFINKNLIPVEGEIIYEIKDKIQEIVESRLIDKPKEEIFGKLEILDTFNPVKGKQLVGGKVLEGNVRNKIHFYLFREEKNLNKGVVFNLKKNKTDVNEINSGEECGLLVDCPETIKKGDMLIFFQKNKGS